VPSEAGLLYTRPRCRVGVMACEVPMARGSTLQRAVRGRDAWFDRRACGSTVKHVSDPMTCGQPHRKKGARNESY